MVKAKFRVHSKTVHSWGTEVELHPVYHGSEENLQFFAATPSGLIRMTVKNELAAILFEPGTELYVDFHKALTPQQESEIAKRLYQELEAEGKA